MVSPACLHHNECLIGLQSVQVFHAGFDFPPQSTRAACCVPAGRRMTAFLYAALLAGLAGGVHCASMCGGVVTALASQDPPAGSVRRRIALVPVPQAPRLLLQLAYNSGRLLTYAVLGALVGTAGSAALIMQQVAPIERLLFAAAHGFMLLIGLYLLGALPVLSRIESLGARLWRGLQPLVRHVLPAHTLPRALAMGLLWGFVPCGMVYTVLISAMLSGSPLNGALTMLAFGVGTLPNVLGLGLLAGAGARWLRSRALRRVGGLLVVLLGVNGIWRATGPTGGILQTLCLPAGVF